jgi:hypothetical protein
MGRATVRSDDARETFLTTLAEQCNVTASCKAAGIGRSTAYDWREDDPGFAAAWDRAVEEATDALEAEARRRAIEGIERPITYQGAVTGHYREYSDRMLELLLRAHRPEKFSERVRNEHTGANGGPIQLERAVSDADEFTRRIAGMAALLAAPGEE